MQLLASCNLEECKGFNGKLVLPNEDNSKPDKVFLNVVRTKEDGSNLEFFAELPDSVKCVTFLKPVSKIPDKWKGNVFNELTLEEAKSSELPNIEGITNLVKLPKDFSDMREVKELSEKLNVRFIGGNLLGIEGIKIGRYDTGKEKMSCVFKDMYDTFVEVDLNNLDGITEIVKKTRKKAEGLGKIKEKKAKKTKSGKPKEPRVPKVSKRSVAFNNLFSEAEEEF